MGSFGDFICDEGPFCKEKNVCACVFTVYKWYYSVWLGQQQMHQLHVKKIFRGVFERTKYTQADQMIFEGSRTLVVTLTQSEIWGGKFTKKIKARLTLSPLKLRVNKGGVQREAGNRGTHLKFVSATY